MIKKMGGGGATGGWSSDPYHFTLNDLKDLGAGETKHQDKGCVAQGGDNFGNARAAGFGFPGNDEFEWGGRGNDCNHCNYDWGKECWGSWEIKHGGRPTVRRKHFLGNETTCCLLNSRGKDTNYFDGDKTCNPETRDPTRQKCTAIYTNHCGSNNRIVTDQNCKNLNATNKTVYDNLMLQYCNHNLSNAKSNECIAYCGNSASCTKLKLSNECAKFGIPQNDNDCTETRVNTLRGDCGQIGILVDNLGGTDLSPCNESAVATIKSQCKDLNIDFSLCTPAKISDELFLAQQRKDGTAQTDIDSALGQDIITRGTIINDALRSLTTPSTVEAPSAAGPSAAGPSAAGPSAAGPSAAGNPKEPKDDSFLIIGIIIAVILILICLSSITGIFVII